MYHIFSVAYLFLIAQIKIRLALPWKRSSVFGSTMLTLHWMPSTVCSRCRIVILQLFNLFIALQHAAVDQFNLHLEGVRITFTAHYQLIMGADLLHAHQHAFNLEGNTLTPRIFNISSVRPLTLSIRTPVRPHLQGS